MVEEKTTDLEKALEKEGYSNKAKKEIAKWYT